MALLKVPFHFMALKLFLRLRVVLIFDDILDSKKSHQEKNKKINDHLMTAKHRRSMVRHLGCRREEVFVK